MTDMLDKSDDKLAKKKTTDQEKKDDAASLPQKDEDAAVEFLPGKQ